MNKQSNHMKTRSIVLLLLVVLASAVSAKIKVHTIGDSTMADYDENTTDKRGWATYLGSFFDPSFVEVNNRGKSGASSRTFYTGSAYWASVKSQMTAGDYVLIQFAHNDENNRGLDAVEYNAYLRANAKDTLTDLRGTHPRTTYKDYLRRYVDETRALNCHPVLVAPICRKYFQGNTIKRNGQHDLGDNFEALVNGQLLTSQSVATTNDSMDYVAAMREVAVEKGVPFIDMTSATRDLYLQYGEAQCTSLLFCQGDNTHTATLGANMIARLAAQMLKDSAILAQYIDIPTSITASPAALAIGETYAGVTQSKEILLTGFGLSPESGTVSITTGGNIKVSVDNTTFATTATASYQASTLFQTVYVQAAYSAAGVQNDTIVISSGSTTIKVPVSAEVISLEGGSEVKATWAIDAKPIADGVATGPIAIAHSLSYLMAADVKSDFLDGSTMVRLHNANDAGAKTEWPGGEIDENATRYIDFAITAPTDKDVKITSIQYTVAAHSTGTMCYHVNTGFGSAFESVQTIYEKRNLTNKQPEEVSLTPTITIPAGETLHIRFLPWHDFADLKSGKYFCLRDLEIVGVAIGEDDGNGEVEDTAIEQTKGEGNAKVRKVIVGNNVVIERNNKHYSLLGAEIK